MVVCVCCMCLLLLVLVVFVVVVVDVVCGSFCLCYWFRLCVLLLLFVSVGDVVVQSSEHNKTEQKSKQGVLLCVFVVVGGVCVCVLYVLFVFDCVC